MHRLLHSRPLIKGIQTYFVLVYLPYVFYFSSIPIGPLLIKLASATNIQSSSFEQLLPEKNVIRKPKVLIFGTDWYFGKGQDQMTANPKP